MSKFAVGFINIGQPIYVYGERTKVESYLAPIKKMKRCIYRQPVNCRFFDSVEKMQDRLQVVKNTWDSDQHGHITPGSGDGRYQMISV